MTGIFTAPISDIQAVRRQGVDALPTSMGDVVSAVAEDAWSRNPVPSLTRWLGRQVGHYDSQMLDAKTATDRYGLPGHLTFDQPVPEDVASDLYDLKQAELYRRSVIDRGPGGFVQGVAELGTGFVVSAIDPINLASAFVPVVGPSRYALAVARAATPAERAVVRGLAGGVEGLAGAAMVEPLVYGVARDEQADYTAADSLLNLAFGTVLGGGLHVTGGHVGDAWSKWKGRDPGYIHQVDSEVQRRLSANPQNSGVDPYVSDALQAFGMARDDAGALERSLAAASPQTREAMLRAAIAQTADDHPVAVKALARMDPALRGEMLDVGRVIDNAIADPLGAPDAMVANLSPQVMEQVMLQKGQAILDETGTLIVEGGAYKKRADIVHSRGAVKFLVKHGEFSDKVGQPDQLTRQDILRLPAILREYEPVPGTNKTWGSGQVMEQRWEVVRADGEHVRYILNRTEDGQMVTASIHVRKPDRRGKLSEKRVAPQSSAAGLNARDTAEGIAHRPSEDRGATGKSYTRTTGNRQANPLHTIQTIYDSSGRGHRVRALVVEADDLLTSHDDDLTINPAFPADLQPRDRGRAAAEQQVSHIAAHLQPERLGQSADASTGAPIVDKDGRVVESGNGRVLALRRVYRDGGEKAAAYRAWLEKQGFDTRSIVHPVLVRRRLDDLTLDERRAFTVDAQKSGTLDLSATESARADAARIGGILPLLDGGDVTKASNRRFVQAFMEQLPQSDQGRLVSADGRLSLDGQRRIESALLASAYDDAGLLARMIESPDDNSRAVVNALLDVAGDWAKMRAAADHGHINPSLDSTDQLLTAVRLVRDARAAGHPLAELLSQPDMFTPRDPMVDRWLGVLLRDQGDGRLRSASRDAIAADLKSYADQAMKSHPVPDMFGHPPPTPNDLFDTLGRDLKTMATHDDDGAASHAFDALVHEREQLDAPPDDSALDAEIDRLIADRTLPHDLPDLAEMRALMDQAETDADVMDAAAGCIVKGL